MLKLGLPAHNYVGHKKWFPGWSGNKKCIGRKVRSIQRAPGKIRFWCHRGTHMQDGSDWCRLGYKGYKSGHKRLPRNGNSNSRIPPPIVGQCKLHTIIWQYPPQRGAPTNFWIKLRYPIILKIYQAELKIFLKYHRVPQYMFFWDVQPGTNPHSNHVKI